jgi:hypothetical protein
MDVQFWARIVIPSERWLIDPPSCLPTVLTKGVMSSYLLDEEMTPWNEIQSSFSD